MTDTIKPINRRHTLIRLKHDQSTITTSTSKSSKQRSISSSTQQNIDSNSKIRNFSISSENTDKRFVVYDDGTHSHYLKCIKRQEKLTNIIKNMINNNNEKKKKDNAVSALPDIIGSSPPSLMTDLLLRQQQVNDTTSSSGIDNSDSFNTAKLYNSSMSFSQKYGSCHEIIGKGSFGVVRICQSKSDKDKLYAVKEFKHKNNEPTEKYSKRLTSEFCISSSLNHINIIKTLDLFQDSNNDFFQVMEFCKGGDLFSLIVTSGKLEYQEADCFFKQLIKGVVYMHEMGVCHRDLKPENIMLTSNGCLKIVDFGNSECFKMAWEKNIHLIGGICGSSPYIAPEEYLKNEFDPRPVDIWACGIIYMAMRTGKQLWNLAKKNDDKLFNCYLKERKCQNGYQPIENLKRARCRNVIYSMLDPVPHRRINGKQILNSEWVREIKCCNTSTSSSSIDNNKKINLI